MHKSAHPQAAAVNLLQNTRELRRAAAPWCPGRSDRGLPLRAGGGRPPACPLRAARAVREGGPVASVDFVCLRLTKSTLASLGRADERRAPQFRARAATNRACFATPGRAPRGVGCLTRDIRGLGSPPPGRPVAEDARIAQSGRARRPPAPAGDRPRPGSGRARGAAAPAGERPRPRATTDAGGAPGSHSLIALAAQSSQRRAGKQRARGKQRACAASSGRARQPGAATRSPTPPAPPPAHHPRSPSLREPSPDGERRATRPRPRRDPLARGPRSRSPC
jgi:hypothetical protein